MRLSLGDRLIMTSSSDWHSGDVKGVQTFTFVAEVTEVDQFGIHYGTVLRISETGRPPFAEVRGYPLSGSATHDYIDRSLKRGTIKLVPNGASPVVISAMS